MIFAARQLQEKFLKQYSDLYSTFVDLTKTFDTVCREGLWKITAKRLSSDAQTSLSPSCDSSMMTCSLEFYTMETCLNHFQTQMVPNTAVYLAYILTNVVLS